MLYKNNLFKQFKLPKAQFKHPLSYQYLVKSLTGSSTHHSPGFEQQHGGSHTPGWKRQMRRCRDRRLPLQKDHSLSKWGGCRRKTQGVPQNWGWVQSQQLWHVSGTMEWGAEMLKHSTWAELRMTKNVGSLRETKWELWFLSKIMGSIFYPP